MEIIDVLKEAAGLVYENVKDMAGTPEAAGDFGIGAGGDVSRNIDVTAESTVIDYLKDRGVGCVLLGEECGRVELPGEPGGFVIMDAIDGSANAVRGVPYFCCSLAYATSERLSAVTDAVVCDLSSNDRYWATKGSGAFMNNNSIRVHDKEPVYRIVGINTSGASADLVQRLQPILENHNHTRHFGANALEMAFLARGLLDVFVDLRDKIRVQDVAAGLLLIREAGGVVLDANLEQLDSDLDYSTRLSFIAASGRRALDDVMSQITN